MLAQALKRAVDMDGRQTGRIREFGLGDWEFKDVALHQTDRPHARHHFAHHMGYAIVGLAAPYICNPFAIDSGINQSH